MTGNPDSCIQYNRELVEKIFRKKETLHRDRALLPIKEKVKILVDLQKMALTLHPKKDKDDNRVPWQIE